MRLREGIICTLKNRLPLPYIAGRHVKHMARKGQARGMATPPTYTKYIYII